MSHGTQSLVFNAAPLFALAAVYFAMGAVLAPMLWRERSRLAFADVALALVFPCLALSAAVLGAVVVVDRKPIGADVWPAFLAILVLFVPAILLLLRWNQRGLVAAGGVRAREAEERTNLRERELEAVGRISNALARTTDPVQAACVLLDEVGSLFGVDLSVLAMVTDDRREATMLAARSEGADVGWLAEVRLDLESEPSGVASAVFDAAPFSVYDAEGSTRISRRLADPLGVKSIAYVPLIAEQRVIGVLIAATTRERRTFLADELALMQALANEAALALERMRSAAELAEALERERLVARISTKVRSELDLDSVLQVAVSETARAVGVQRCFIRLGEPGGEMPMAAEWTAPDTVPLGDVAERLPASNLAARERRTVAIADAQLARELDDASLGGREVLLGLGTLAVLATPIVVFDEMIGVFGLHRATSGPWSAADVALAEAAAREVGLALHTARLLQDNEARIDEQAALLRAARALSGELELEAVLQSLVDEVADLLGAEAADCYLFLPRREMLRCAAVHGLSRDLVGLELPVDRGVSGEAFRLGRPVISSGYDERREPPPHAAYEGFTDVVVAPMTWSGTARGVLGVGVRGTRRFTERDADLLAAFAGLAALALKNAESFEDRSRQARIQRGFYRVASVLGQSLSLAATLDAVARAASEAFGGTAAAVFRPLGGRLALAGSHDLPEPFRAALAAGIPEDAAVLESAALESRVLACPTVADDDRFGDAWRTGAAEAGYRSLLAVPVDTSQGEGRGLVLVFFGDERPFTDDDLELAQHLAGAARGSLERAELFEAERSARALAQQLARTGALLATELDPAAVLDEVVQQAPELLGADACTIRVFEGEDLLVSAATGDGADEALGSRSPSTGWLSGDVVQSRAPLAVEEVSDDPRLRELDPMLAAGLAAYLGVPLVGPEGALHGVLSVYARTPRAWRDDEIEALTALAANTSVALSNAELYQQVADEQKRSSAILANIADGIVAVDREGKVVLWNQAAEQITGVPQEEALGRLPAQVLQRSLEAEGDAVAGDRVASIVRAGHEVWLSLTEAVMRDPSGAVAGRIFAFRDISADRLVEQMKSDFVSAVSHELRTPLTSIYGFAETLLRRDVLFGEEERQTFLGYIASESERLTRIVDALLNVARLDTGDLQVNLAPVDVGPLVEEVVAYVQEGIAVDGHRFVVELPEDPLAVEADREKLREILAELVDNAIKYSPAGGTVTVAARRKGATVELEVADEGIGIPPQEQDRIFRKFYRAESATREGGPGGTGLGLFIAQGLVGAMGGRIRVSSAEGEGSVFTFELPLARALAAASA